MNSPNVIPSATVILPYVLREKVGSQKSITVLAQLYKRLSTLSIMITPVLSSTCVMKLGELRPYVNIFLNRENIRFLEGLDIPLYKMGATIYILQSVAGGCS